MQMFFIRKTWFVFPDLFAAHCCCYFHKPHSSPPAPSPMAKDGFVVSHDFLIQLFCSLCSPHPDQDMSQGQPGG